MLVGIYKSANDPVGPRRVEPESESGGRAINKSHKSSKSKVIGSY